MTVKLPRIPRRLALVAAALALAAVVFGLAGLVTGLYAVRYGDAAFLSRSAIVAKLAQETPVYYLDGKTQLGSFFGDAHRRYVPIDKIPDSLIKAVVASEDKKFFTHGGIDYAATAKAFLEGLEQGNFHRAGSTITQQTVKILFNDWEHSFRRKVTEAVAALKMERLYTKRQILEFYLNQFHVTGNGNGVGIASRYYFNKDVQDLDLTEAAFIAGSVKNPTKFNPFTKTSLPGRALAEKAAFERKNYVLRRMLQDGAVSKAEFERAAARPVPFNHGEFQSAEVALIELVRRQLETPEILTALGIKDKEELNHAGIKVFTTLDAQLQADAQLAVRRNLARLDLILTGFQPEARAVVRKLSTVTPNEFYYGTVESVSRDPQAPSVGVSFGMVRGTIAAASLRRVASYLSAASGKPAAAHVRGILKALAPGDVVFTQVLSYDPASHQAELELQKRPEINGGLIAIDAGEVRAVVSGFDTAGYNRSVFGTRQPGSVFKSVVFYAALQLGWSILDQLHNEPQVFPYQGRFYYPRGAHESPYEDETMLYAGAESENIATVYLTAHLLDRLSFEEFQRLLGLLGLLPAGGEAPAAFQHRIARSLGVTLDSEGVKEYQLENAVQDLNPDLVFAGEQAVARQLRGLWWGRGYQGELAKLAKLSRRGGGAKPAAEAAQRIRLVLNNYQRLAELATALTADWSRIQLAVQLRGGAAAFQNPEILALVRRFTYDPPSGQTPPGVAYWGDLPIERQSGGVGVRTAPMTVADAEAVWGAADGPQVVPLAAVRLGGYLPMSVLAALKAKLDARVTAALADHDRFGLYQLYQHHDIRLALGLNYLIALGQAMGVQSKLSPVLSFALGTNAVSLADIAKVYQTFVDGKTYRFFADGSPNQLTLIRRIEGPDGRVLYAAERRETQLVAPGYCAQIQEILRKVVTNGTGSVLMQEVTVSAPGPAAAAGPTGAGAAPSASPGVQIRVPVFGKTGTTNDFTNGTFAGLLPYPTEASAPLAVGHSYVIAAYAGFDGNQPMRNGRFRGYGGAVALPAWSEFARGVLKHKDYAKFVDALDLATIAAREWPLRVDDQLVPFKVDLVTGALLAAGAEEPAPAAATAGEQATASEVDAQRHEVFVRIPGEVKVGTFAPTRVVNPFRAEAFGHDAEAFDADDEEAAAPGPAAQETESQATPEAELPVVPARR